MNCAGLPSRPVPSPSRPCPRTQQDDGERNKRIIAELVKRSENQVRRRASKGCAQARAGFAHAR